jgi:hypothetical protein
MGFRNLSTVVNQIRIRHYIAFTTHARTREPRVSLLRVRARIRTRAPRARTRARARAGLTDLVIQWDQTARRAWTWR